MGATLPILLDGLGVAAALIDAQLGQVLHANDFFCRILDRELEEILRAPNLLQFVHPEDRSSHLACTSQYVNSLVDRSRFEARYLRADGGSVHMRITQAGIRDHTGELLWITLVLDDSAEPNGTAPSGDREGKLCSLDHGKVTIWNWTPENNAAGHPAGYKVLFGAAAGSQPQSIEELAECVHPDDAKAVQLLFKRSLNGLPGTQDHRLFDDGAGVRWVREMVAPIKDAAGRLTNVIGMSIDITENKSQEPDRKSAELRSLVQYLQTHWDKPLVLSEVARQHGVGARSLQKHFSSLGTTPVDFLKCIRLVHAHEMLSEPGAKITVTEVCAKCCFGNLGHFARDYRSKFGELPSETLRRARSVQAGSMDVLSTHGTHRA
jgi:PAS domain S-box-containing protein